MRKPQSAILRYAFRTPSLVFMLSLAFLAFVGFSVIEAGDKKSKDNEGEERKEPRTIGDVVAVDGLQSYVVEGIGLVVGLDDTGSDPAPGPDRGILLMDMQKRRVEAPEELLRSPKTALVKIHAKIPPAVRGCKSAGCWCRSDSKSGKSAGDGSEGRPHKGDTFDVEVEVPNRDSTKSLQGGWLLEAWLFETATLQGAGTFAGHVRGRASGPVLVAGGLDGTSSNPADLRRGRILGGGIAKEDRDFFLITSSDKTARWTLQVSARINERFPQKTREGKPVAEAKNGQLVQLKIPPRYRQNIARYLEVLRYMPVSQTGSQEAERMLQYGEDLLNPATARRAAIKLEGIGIRASDTLKKGLTSSDPDVRFFAAEALAYLGDPAAGELLAQTAREVPEYRAHALTALSSLDETVSRVRLRELLADSDSAELRYGAFRALRVLDADDPAIPGTLVGDRFRLNRVPGGGRPIIHATSRDRAEIVLFGDQLKLQPPMLLNAGSSILLTASENADQIQMVRFEVGKEQRREFCGLEIGEVIQKASRMGATYPDIVGLLANADKNQNLPGRLDLDALPDPTRLITRLKRISKGPDKATETAAMPNLYRWSEPKKSGPKDPSDSGDDVASTDSDDSEGPKKYITKPSFFDRLFGRTAN